MNKNRSANPRRLSALAIVVALLPVVTIGCPGNRDTQTASRHSVQGLGRRVDQGQKLLENVIAQLRDLPAAIVTDLQPPQVVLDSRSSGDGQDVLAVVGANPQVADGPSIYNIMHVPAGNSRFRALGVKTGDFVKYYIGSDTSGLVSEQAVFGTSGSATGAAGDDPQWSEGFVRKAAIEFPIAQVLDDTTLILGVALPFPINEPEKIEVWRYADDRMLEIGRRLGRYVTRGTPRLGWEPSPDERALTQMLDRLNPWARQRKPLNDWQPSKLLATLSEEIAADEKLAPLISHEKLAQLPFDAHEIRLVQQAVWMRDISEWARGDSFDPLERASKLFDWTVRNIQLDADDDYRARWPWQTVLYGQGTAEQRAWVFAQLCRQQKMDVVILQVPDDPGQTKFWLPALLHEGQLYLFDTRLGLPLPGSDDTGVATLAELAANAERLSQLSVNQLSYSVSADQIRQATAAVVASPFALSQRAKLLETEFTGDDRLVLSVDADALAKQVGALANVGDVTLWNEAYRAILEQLRRPKSKRIAEATEFEPFAWRPLLYKARVLHFQGTDEVRKDPSRGNLTEEINSHREASRLYTSPRVRPPKKLLDELPSDDKRTVYSAAKSRATYWLGLLSYEEGRYKIAADWLLRRTLAAQPDGPWTSGARYNLARTYEQLGRTDEAIALYEADESPQRLGNLLRARRLSRSE